MRTLLFVAAAASLSLLACNNQDSTDNNTGKAPARLREENLSYMADTTSLNAYIASKDTAGKRPAILVVHEWWGLNDYTKERAKQLAEMDYVAMAVDMFGKGRIAANPEEAMQLSGPFYSNPELGKGRLDAAIAELKKRPDVDSSKIAAIGYCFGGAIVLNAAKMGSDLDGVVSFHGSLPGVPPRENLLKAEILVCHGTGDAFVSEADSLQFRKQMDSIGAVYIFKSYPGAKHAFTNPKADDYSREFKLDIGYNEEADKASWEDMKQFLKRIFE